MNNPRREQDLKFLRQSVALSVEAKERGELPFGALIVGPDGEVVLTGFNAFTTDRGPGHAETNLAREAARRYDSEFLRKCTLYTSIQPCAMCAATVYWAEIGRLVYGATEADLAELVGGNPDNKTMDLPCEKVLAAGAWQVEVAGYPEFKDEALKIHVGYW
ncbi:MAG: nucleoside deaminase [Rhodobacterales bacterium]|nr:nucleoside deaminase [Rhodobacterales bacterium]